MVRTVSANVNMQLVGKQMLPALNILHSLLALHRKGMENMPLKKDKEQGIPTIIQAPYSREESPTCHPLYRETGF